MPHVEPLDLENDLPFASNSPRDLKPSPHPRPSLEAYCAFLESLGAYKKPSLPISEKRQLFFL